MSKSYMLHRHDAVRAVRQLREGIPEGDVSKKWGIPLAIVGQFKRGELDHIFDDTWHRIRLVDEN